MNNPPEQTNPEHLQEPNIEASSLATPAAPTFNDLEGCTSEFFRFHWPADFNEAPNWVSWQEFLKGSVPNHQHGGCYAIFSGPSLIYIGLGVSRGGGIYQQHGISRRLMAHVLRSDLARGRQWSKLDESWRDATAIYTLGFPGREYLAPALESYLIRELSPPRNSRV